ncbi:serpin family protein, partial [Bacteroides stercoris]|uniref:serpin family protein n=3 Tax=Bacteroides TaxID=816 RepID=UPI0034A2E9FA
MKTLFTFRRFDRLKDYLQDKYSIVQPLKLERDIKNFLLFATGISLCILVSCQQTSSHKPFVELSSLELSEEEMPMVSISNDFACSFFQKMNEQEKGQSFFISPLSAQFNLGMLANGAAGKTLEEIASVLSVSKSKPSLANNYFLKLIS